jgi:NADH:ubiquinone oxidoreductase subunit B-like Fe-S oxidoreductase
MFLSKSLIKTNKEEINTKFLVFETDKHMNWKTHIQLVLPKLSSACYAIRCMKHYSNIETLKIYYAYFHSIVTWSDLLG